MKQQSLLLLLSINSYFALAEIDQCASDFPLVTDFSSDDCPTGTYYEENHLNCFPGCYTAVSDVTLISCNPLPCPPGYKCPDGNDQYCELDEDSCFKYYAAGSPYSKALWKPTCTVDGKWEQKQCKGESTNGRCFCFDAVGNRIFGQAWVSEAEDMTCACSRKKKELLDSGRWFVSFHCDSMGNFEELQCDSGQCWCVEPKTGALKSSVVTESMMKYLPCYDKTIIGERYLRQCESQAYAQALITHEFQTHGNNYANFATLLCDYDGSYGAYKINNGIAYCTWRDNSFLGSWQTEVNANIGSVSCNCARDSKVYELAGFTQSQLCLGNGNYKPQQQSGDRYYCVDGDGFIKSGYFNELPDCDLYY